MKKYFKIFMISFIAFAIGMIGAIIPTRGIWVHYGDFNVQQIPFYIHVHDAIRSGNLLYDWSTDLGGSLIGCYSFYILGSPFFWLTVPFPSAWVPYLIPWVNCLKYAVMATLSFLYIRKHTKTDEGAFIGAMLFTFSGYSGAVLVFNHFHDSFAFFPLYLYTFEKAMEEKKRIPFALMTLLMAVINYYFFVGQVVFLIIVFFVRYFDLSDIKNSLLKMARALWCGACGVALSCLYVIPAVYYTTGNKRLSQVLSGDSLLVYDEPTMWLGIIKSILILPDISGLNSMFNQGYSRVSGVAGYLPLVSISCVLAFFFINKGQKKVYEKNVLIVSAVFAAVPFLNSLFSALNSEYYARWFYMPVLFMAMVSGKVLEELDKETYPQLKRGVKITIILTIALWACALLPTKRDNSWTILGSVKNSELLLTEIVFSAVMILVLFVLTYAVIPMMMKKHYDLQRKRLEYGACDESFAKELINEVAEECELEDGDVIDSSIVMKPFHERKKYKKLIMMTVLLACFATSTTMLVSGKLLVENERCNSFIDQAIKGGKDIELSDARFYRIETDEDIYNYPLIWSRPSITSFISTIPFSTIDFYSGIGMGRKVTSRIHESRLGARTLLSGKYYLIERPEHIAIETIGHIDDPESLKGYELTDTQDGFDVYKNENFVPMGFSFDYYITEHDYENNDAASGSLDKMLLKALILDEETQEKYGHYFERITAEEIPPLSNADVPYLTRDLQATACTKFKPTTHGFTASADMAKETLLFFSVPYESGFKAYVDGQESEIIKVDYGFMSVVVPEGEHDIEFRYTLSNWKIGAFLCAGGVVLLLALLILHRIENPVEYEDDDEEDEEESVTE